jgi:ABC-type transporter Mla subunit MlaD
VGGQGEYRRYVIHFEHQALDGLDVGAEVSLRGIRVGRVEDYALSPAKFNRVRVTVRLDRRAPVYTNTVAVVSRNFVTGIASITLFTPEPPGAVLTEAADGETEPRIAEGQSDMQEIVGRVSKVGEMASVTLAQLNQLLSSQNRDDAMGAIRAVRDLAVGLNHRMGALERALQSTATAMRQMGAAADRVGAAGDRIAGVAEGLGSQADTALAETRTAVADARRAIDDARQALLAIQTQTVSTARRLEDSATNIDDQLTAAVADLRSTVDSAGRLLDRLADPRAALLGPAPNQLGPGEAKR